MGETPIVRGAVARADRRRTLGLGVVVLAEIMVLLSLVAGAYAWAGWHRMESACQPDSHGGVSYSWSWSAPGFSCTWDDDRSVTKLWW